MGRLAGGDDTDDGAMLAASIHPEGIVAPRTVTIAIARVAKNKSANHLRGHHPRVPLHDLSYQS